MEEYSEELLEKYFEERLIFFGSLEEFSQKLRKDITREILGILKLFEILFEKFSECIFFHIPQRNFLANS